MKTIKFILAIYKELFLSAFSFIRGVFSDREAWGDLFHGLGVLCGTIIFGSILLGAAYWLMYLAWTLTPDHKFFWIITVLGSICIFFKIGDWLKGE